MTPTEKTPAQIEKEQIQKDWEAAVKSALEIIVAAIPNLDAEDTDTRAHIYREMLGLKQHISQCGPEIRKMYNQAIDALFPGKDIIIPNSVYLTEDEFGL